MMKRLLALALTALMLLACAFSAVAEENDRDYYIYTENGKPLNVRSLPNGPIVGALKSGTKIEVDSLVNDSWALISFQYDNGADGVGNWPAYVNRRFLTREDPAAKTEGAEAEESTGDPMADINAEFAAAVPVEHYQIMIRPARVSSWVNLRWIPGTTGMVIAEYKANDKLTVLMELKNYLMVQDPKTGRIGYIEKGFAVR